MKDLSFGLDAGEFWSEAGSFVYTLGFQTVLFKDMRDISIV